MSQYVLIHGAWGGAWEFEETSAGLARLGHTSVAIDLPGHGQRGAPIDQVTMESYVDAVVQTVEEFSEPVILVGHSLAGAIVSQVAERIPGSIERLVFVAAFLPKHGETPMELMQGDPDGRLLPRLAFAEDQSFVTVDEAAVRELFLNDVKDEKRLAKFLPHFVMRQATQPFMAPARLTQQHFGSVAKSYIRASEDQVLSPVLQTRMLNNWDVDQVLSLDSGHFPLMSMPERLVRLLAETSSVQAS